MDRQEKKHDTPSMPLSDPPSASAKDECIVVQHSLPPEEMHKYSPVRDPASEEDIARYVEGQARDETVKHVEKIKTEYVLGDPYEVWDVTTDKDRWWVITNLTNLYSQKHFPSLDYTLSFHIGLTMRIRSRPEGADASDPHPFDEVFRRQEQAKDRYDRAIEAEDYQAVGMQLRECLISLISVLRRRVAVSDTPEPPKDADVVGWLDLLMNNLCPGGSNKELRQYLKTTSKSTWQLVNWLTHDRDANQTASLIAIEACDTMIGHSVAIFMREKRDKTEACPRCLSRHVRMHFDISIGSDGEYYSTCGKCDWTNHPSLTASEQSASEP